MVRLFSLGMIGGALALSSVVAAQDIETSSISEPQGQPVKLVNFDGEFELLKTSQRLRIWRTHLGYKISVNAAGEATECELTDEFRRTYVKKSLCKVLMKHHTFDAARDAENAPVDGTYVARLSYKDMRDNQ